MKMEIKIVNDVDKAIFVMHDAGKWREESDKEKSKWWHPDNMNREFLLQHVEPSEFYVALVDGEPAAAMVLQDNQRNQDWSSFDKGKKVDALYIHWVAVTRKYAGKGLPKLLMDFAVENARSRGLHLLRLDTSADAKKLVEIYEKLGFRLVHKEKEGTRTAAFFQMQC